MSGSLTGTVLLLALQVVSRFFKVRPELTLDEVKAMLATLGGIDADRIRGLEERVRALEMRR